MSNHKKIISFVFLIFMVEILLPNRLIAQKKDSTALSRKIIISAGYGDPSMIYVDNWINNGFNSDKKVTPQINPIYGKIEFRIFRHIGIGVDVSYDDYEATQTSSNTNSTVVYKGYTFFADLRINRHVHLINKKLDLYWGVGLGYQIQAINNIIDQTALKPGTNPVAFEFTFGARYYITKRIGLYVEGGIARSVFQGGLCFRF